MTTTELGTWHDLPVHITPEGCIAVGEISLPPMSYNFRADLQSWLRGRGVTFEDEMTKTNADVYPITATLERNLSDMPERWAITLDDVLEYVGEYEHGSVDPENIIPALATIDDDTGRRQILEAMSAVLVDFLGYVAVKSS